MIGPDARAGAGDDGPGDYLRWRPALARALDPRLYPIEYLDALVGSMRAQAWFGEKAVLVTELRRFPSGAAAICVLAAAGEMREIVEVLRPRAEKWAAEAGCAFSIVESRSGWQRSLAPHGYAPFQVGVIRSI